MQPSIIMQITEIINGSNIAKFFTHHVPSYLFSVGFSCIFLLDFSCKISIFSLHKLFS